MRFENFSFGSVRIDGTTYEDDVVINRGQVRKRKKKPSKKFREEFGHTPLSIEEKIPWNCRRLVIGTGTGAVAGHGRGEGGGSAPEGRAADPADIRGDRRAEARGEGYECHPPRNLLSSRRRSSRLPPAKETAASRIPLGEYARPLCGPDGTDRKPVLRCSNER